MPLLIILASEPTRRNTASLWMAGNPPGRHMGIGTKNYGSCNGIIYKNRSSVDYFKQVAEIEDYGYILLNQQWKKAWGGII